MISYLVDVECVEIKFLVNNEEIYSNVCNSIKEPIDLQVVLVIDLVDDKMTNIIKENLVDELKLVTLKNLGSKVTEEKDKLVNLTISHGTYNKNLVRRTPYQLLLCII